MAVPVASCVVVTMRGLELGDDMAKMLVEGLEGVESGRIMTALEPTSTLAALACYWADLSYRIGSEIECPKQLAFPAFLELNQEYRYLDGNDITGSNIDVLRLSSGWLAGVAERTDAKPKKYLSCREFSSLI